MSGEALRAAVYTIGSMLVLVGGMDDALVAAGIPALGLISAGVAKVVMALGTFAVGWARTGKTFGDFALKDVSEALRDTVAPANTTRKTDPGMGAPKA